MWVMMTYFPLQVDIDDEGLVRSLISEINLEVAMDHGLKGCWFCHTPLNDSTVSSDCLGE